MKEYDGKLSDIMKDEHNILAVDNIEQSHSLEDPELWKEIYKSLSNEDIPEADEGDDLEGTKCELYNQETTPDTIGDTYLSAELAILRHGYGYCSICKSNKI